MSDTLPALFTDAQKTDIRRFCGYPAYGAGAWGFEGRRFFQAYGLLEYRMNNLSPAEMTVVTNYLATLYTLEAAVTNTGGGVDAQSVRGARADRAVRRLAAAAVRVHGRAERARPGRRHADSGGVRR